MDIRPRSSLVAAVLIAVALASCSDDNSPTGGGTPDTTPPTVSTVTPVDAFHMDVTFNEQVTKTSAEDENHYTITPAPLPLALAARGGLSVINATLKNDKKTVALTTDGSMSGVNFNLGVTGVSDTHGNDIIEGISKPFTGSDNPDVTAPTIIEKSPAAGATHVAVNTPVTIKFSEPVDYATFVNGVSWTVDAGVVDVEVANDGTVFTLTPYPGQLGLNQVQTIGLTGVKDPSGNIMADAEWSFTTTNVADHTPPTLVSTSPANFAAGVDVNANVSMTFSEPVSQFDFPVNLAPDPGDGVKTWSNGGKTVTFDPTAPLMTDQQYTLSISPNFVIDLAGNPIAEVHILTFTTAAQLEEGSISGTITGDGAFGASDPTGAVVVAIDASAGGNSAALGSAVVASDDTYGVLHLPDGVYYIVTGVDSNHDEYPFYPLHGDAFGWYGIDYATADGQADSVVVAGGAHVTGKDFALYDPATASGTWTYAGDATGKQIFVGLFDTTGFSPTGEPVARTEAAYDHSWIFNSLDQGLADGDYFVGAFMDVNSTGNFEPAIDPAGFYGGLPTPTTLHLTNGADLSGIVIQLTDPAPGLVAPASVIWPKAKHNPAIQRLVEALRQTRQEAGR